MPNPRQPFQPYQYNQPPVSQGVGGIRPMHQARVSAAPNAYAAAPTFQPGHRYAQPGHPGQPGYPANMGNFGQQHFAAQQYNMAQHYQQNQTNQFQPGAQQFQTSQHVPNPQAQQYIPQQFDPNSLPNMQGHQQVHL